jgi:hypothetical protein
MKDTRRKVEMGKAERKEMTGEWKKAKLHRLSKEESNLTDE